MSTGWFLPLSLLIAIFCVSNTFASGIAPGACKSSNLISGKLITDVAWSSLFPIRIAGVTLVGGDFPDDAVEKPVCMCPDDKNLPRPGLTTSMWEPARLIEFQRIPGCSSVLNGTQLPFEETFLGMHGENVVSGEQESSSFTHYHYYAFPLLSMLDLFTRRSCSADGFLDLDLMYISELDPTWNNDELAFFTSPEAVAVANPIAVAACAAEAVSSQSKKPIDSMFWCAGSWGEIYPLSGHVSGGYGVLMDTALRTSKVLASLHRRGLSWKTMGEESMCEGKIYPMLPKSQYKFNIIYPLPQTRSDFVIGESVLKWGANRIIPGVAEDPIYVIWRWNDCCNTM